MTASFFPEHLTQLLDETDLSKHLSGDPLAEYRLKARATADGEIVVLFEHSLSKGHSVHILNESLDYLGSADDDPANPDDELEEGVVWDPTGYLYVGNVTFDTSFEPTGASGNVWSMPGYFDGGNGIAGNPVIILSRTEGTFDANGYPSGGDGTAQPTTRQVDDGSTPVNVLLDLTHDLPGNRVIFFFGAFGSSTLYVLPRSDSDLFGSLPNPLFPALTPEASVLTIEGYSGNTDSLFYTRRGIVVRLDNGKLVAYGLDGTSLGALPRSDDGDWPVIAPGIAGRHYYLFDPDSRKLRKARAWW